MERFGGDEKVVSLSDEQRKELAAIDEKFNAKIAEKELFLNDLLQKASESGDFREVEEIEEQKRRELGKLDRDLESEKDTVRNRETET